MYPNKTVTLSLRRVCTSAHTVQSECLTFVNLQAQLLGPVTTHVGEEL